MQLNLTFVLLKQLNAHRNFVQDSCTAHLFFYEYSALLW